MKVLVPVPKVELCIGARVLVSVAQKNVCM